MNHVNKEMVPIEPQPKNGPPFQISFSNRGPEYWYNERLSFRRNGRFMLFEWKCPFGAEGIPKKIDGVWYWIRREANQEQ